MLTSGYAAACINDKAGFILSESNPDKIALGTIFTVVSMLITIALAFKSFNESQKRENPTIIYVCSDQTDIKQAKSGEITSKPKAIYLVSPKENPIDVPPAYIIRSKRFLYQKYLYLSNDWCMKNRAKLAAGDISLK